MCWSTERGVDGLKSCGMVWFVTSGHSICCAWTDLALKKVSGVDFCYMTMMMTQTAASACNLVCYRVNY